MPRKAAKRKARRKSEFYKRIEDFSVEMESFGNKMEKEGNEWGSWFHRTFGIIGPLISSMFGLLVLALILVAMKFINFNLGSSLLSSISVFFTVNMGLFFLIFLFLSYTSYFSRFYSRLYTPFYPIFSAIGITITLWVFARVISIVSIYIGVDILYRTVFFIDRYLSEIFWLILFIGYIILIIKLSCCCKGKEVKTVMRRTVKSSGSNVKRLYRSGKDKILGGVCGGIAEYLGVDPVIIRLLWVIAVFGWGAGILAYIIAWIIIPRNPRHKWN